MKQDALSPTVSALLRARVLIETNWCKGFGHDGQVCAVEAVWKATESDAPIRQRGVSLRHLLHALPPDSISVMSYNDAKTTTKADILALYDRAIDLALKAED